jgi:hypothetical protein
VGFSLRKTHPLQHPEMAQELWNRSERARERGWMESELAVAAVAHARIGGVLASAKIDGLGFGGLVFHGRESGSLVASVAKRLVGAASASAPEIGFGRFYGDGIWAFLGNDRIRHDEGSSRGDESS